MSKNDMMLEAAEWWRAIAFECLNPDRFSLEEGDRLIDEGYDVFMGLFMQDISDNIDINIREGLCAEFFCPGVELEDRVIWYMSLCEALGSYLKMDPAESFNDFIDGVIDAILDWGDCVYLSIPHQMREALDKKLQEEYVKTQLSNNLEILIPKEKPETFKTEETEIKPFRNFELN